MSDLSLAARVRARYEREMFHLRHRFRTNTDTRDRMVIGSTAALLAVGLLAAALRPGAWSWSVAAAAVLTLGVVRLAMLRAATPPHAHGLPGQDEPEACPAPDAPDRTPFVWAVRWLGAAIAVSIAAGASPVFVWGGVVALLAAAVPVTVDKVRLWRTRLALRRALAEYEPRFVLGYGGYGGGPIHVGMWEPHLIASGDRGIIVGLRPEYCAELRAGIRPTLPWVQAGSDALGDMRVMTVPSITTFFYVHNAAGHLRLLGMRSVRHVWLGHGDSDKTGSHHERHQRYDLLVASGEAAVDRYARHGVDIPRERFVLLGRPQSSDVLPATTPVTLIARPTVLYTPTWTGNGSTVDFSSISVADRIVHALIAVDANVIFRPHPVFLRSPYWAPKLREIEQILQRDHEDPDNLRRHAWGEDVVRVWTVADCMNRADALVSDVSSVVSDWLASAKPYLMVSMQHDLGDFVREVPVAAGGYLVGRDLAGLDAMLGQMLHDDPLAERRRALKVEVLGEFEGDESAVAFAAYVHELAHTPMVRS